MKEIRLRFDVAVMEDRIANLTGLVLAKFPEGVPEHLFGDLRSLGSDLVFGDLESAVGTDSVIEILYPMRFGARLEDFASTLGATERDRLRH
jgi:hypothetical protein